MSDLMLLEPHVVESSTDLVQLQALVRRNGQRVFPVVGPRGYVGLLVADAIERGSPGVTAAGLIERDAPVLAATDGLEASLPSVASAPARALVVLDGSSVVGLLRMEEVEQLLSRLAREPKSGA